MPTPSSSAFDDAYAKLNPRQREAVDTIEGPVMVIAGPGTGKTQILTLRIANILKRTDLPPGAILALTFTEAATANMRKRLVELTGDHRAYYVAIHTFHGFANQLIQEYPEYFPAIIGARNAAEVDQVQLVRDILEHGVPGAPAFERLKPMGDIFYHVPDILSAIKSVKNEGYAPADFVKLLDAREADLKARPDLYHEKGQYAGRMKGEYEKEFATLERNRELATVYAAYEDGLRAARLYDFEDMILAVIRAFESRPEFLLQAQERFQYLLVDEHQDTNGAQNRLLELLASYYERPNLFVVGDEKQAIFRFQGASLENFLYFQGKYPDARVIYLEDNYRSYQPVLDAAASVIGHNATVMKRDLTAARGEGADGARRQIEIVAVRTPEAEEFAVSEIVRERIAAGVPPEEIAVLYRQNSDAAALADMLARRGVPYVIESDRDVLTDPDIRNILLLAEAIADFGNDALLAEALHLDFLGLEPLEVYKLISGEAGGAGGGGGASADTRDLFATLRTNRDGSETPSRRAYGSLYERVARTPLGDKLSKWKRDSMNQNFLNFFETLIRESGFLEMLMTRPQRLQKLAALTALWNEMRRTVGERGAYRLTDFVRHLDIIRTHHLAIRTAPAAAKGAVRLMTAHKAKGLEFDCVIVTGATDGHWGNRRDPARFKLPFRTAVDAAVIEKNEDERRLFYMALTRARNELFITYARERMDGKAEVPSQFLGEIREDLRHEDPAAGERYEKALEAARPELFAERDERLPAEAEREYLLELFKKRGLSATGLNNYLKCPWNYFYVNLLRIPQLPTLNQMYGTAVHAALENFFAARKRGELVGKEFLIDSYTQSLRRQPLVDRDLQRLLAKGTATLAAYHDHYADQWNYNAVTELRLKVPFGDDPVVLNGVLDKLELAADGSKDVTVVDYKTRVPKSRNWIEGNTADSAGDYKRQLVFYKLLLDSSPELGYRMRAGAIDFVEPNERGAFKKEAFEITEAEVGELRQTIARVIEEVRGLSFWNEKCDDPKCTYCDLRARMRE